MAGNIILESNIEGRKTSWADISILEGLFINSPNTIPILKLAVINKSKDKKYPPIFLGNAASIEQAL